MPGRPVYATARQGLRTRLADALAARSRAARHRLYRDLLRPRPRDRILDVGCGAAGLAAFEPEAELTGVDLLPHEGYEGPNRRFVQADARALPFEDGAFDIAYSNSLIEHLAPADRAAFAAEIRRVGRRWFVQTPNRWFPVEPHVLLPLFQFLPLALRRRLWHLGVAGGEFEDIRLLSARELRALFPDGVLVRERSGPLVKSLVVAGPAGRVTRRRASG